MTQPLDRSSLREPIYPLGGNYPVQTNEVTYAWDCESYPAGTGLTFTNTTGDVNVLSVPGMDNGCLRVRSEHFDPPLLDWVPIEVVTATFPTTSVLHGYFRVRLPAYPSAGKLNSLFGIQGPGGVGTGPFSITVDDAGKLAVRDFNPVVPTVVKSAAGMSLNTTYHIWFTAASVTGTHVLVARFALNDTYPSGFGPSVALVGAATTGLLFGGFAVSSPGSGYAWFDKLRLNTFTRIDSSPP